MRIHQLIKVKNKGNKRVGRGIGSGKGKTAGRGNKGQKARGKIPPTFSGDLSFYKKLPKRRGLGNPKFSPNPKIVFLSLFKYFPAKSTIDLEALLKAKVITEKEAKRGVKILGTGEVKKALVVKLPVSKTAKEKILKVKGQVTYA
ncbi:MAG: 50S ribosomal protein L15 [Patescibacteria group bacterium]